MRDVAQNKAPVLYNTQIRSSRARFACLTAVCMKIEKYSGTRRRVECTVTDVYQNLPASIFTKSWTALPDHMETTSSPEHLYLSKNRHGTMPENTRVFCKFAVPFYLPQSCYRTMTYSLQSTSRGRQKQNAVSVL
jgi:hypothetical protein